MNVGTQDHHLSFGSLYTSFYNTYLSTKFPKQQSVKSKAPSILWKSMNFNLHRHTQKCRYTFPHSNNKFMHSNHRYHLILPYTTHRLDVSPLWFIWVLRRTNTVNVRWRLSSFPGGGCLKRPSVHYFKHEQTSE